MSGGAWGGSLNWTSGGGGGGRAQRTAQRQIREATEADLIERGILPPPSPMSQASIFWAGFFVGLLLGLLIGGVVWELT
jgi:hypothetical protein